MNHSVEVYLAEGCGRCPLGATPACKVYAWQEEMKQLRRILLECGLTEEVKWSAPCYTFQGNNILIMAAFKGYCFLSFFKGVLLYDEAGILTKAGENSQSARLISFTNVQQVLDNETILKAYIFEAIEIEKAGLKVEFKQKNELVFPAELLQKFEENPPFKMAFESLTLGRQRGYNLYFSAPKQTKTRQSRIEKYMEKILAGKGMLD